MNEISTNQQKLSLKEQRQKDAAVLESWMTDPKIKKRFADAVRPFIDPDLFHAQMVISLNDSKLVDCTPISKYKAAMFCATLGLMPALQQVALIPRDTSRGRKQSFSCDVMPQWQGYQSLMLRNSEVEDVTAHLVHTSDRFHYSPTEEPKILHEFDPFDEERTFKTMKDIRGSYLIVSYKDRSRERKIHFCTREYLSKCREEAKTQDIWNAWFEQMLLKTTYNSAFRRRVVPIDFANGTALQKFTQQEDGLNEVCEPVTTSAALLDDKRETTSRADKIAQRLYKPTSADQTIDLMSGEEGAPSAEELEQEAREMAQE